MSDRHATRVSDEEYEEQWVQLTFRVEDSGEILTFEEVSDERATDQS